MSLLNDTVKRFDAPIEHYEETAFRFYKLWRQEIAEGTQRAAFRAHLAYLHAVEQTKRPASASNPEPVIIYQPEHGVT